MGIKVITNCAAYFDWDGAQLAFLWPRIVPEEVAPSAKNHDSLVFRRRSFLEPGAAEKSS